MPRYIYQLNQDYTAYEVATVEIDATSEEDALAQLEETIDNGDIDWECLNTDYYSGLTYELEGIEHQTPSIRISEL